MANGRGTEVYPHGHPRVYQRTRQQQQQQVVRQSLPTIAYPELFGYILSRIVSIFTAVFLKLCPQWVRSWVHWCPTSPELLEIVEQDVLCNLKRPYKGQFINIGKCIGSEDNFVWTISLNENADKTPLVLLHGFACGVGLWVMNLDSISSTRPVYAIDMLGFGRSSRPEYSADALECEMQFFISLERWRTAVGLEKVILVGHSMGGYIAASYAFHYPERVASLILVDPWGLPERPISFHHRYEIDPHVRFFDSFMHGFNFLATVRVAGPAGPHLVKQFRSDLRRKYGHFLQDPQCIIDYVYHCNAQNPSGEAAFKAMTDESGWAKQPMVHRLISLNWNIPITFIYGSRSWGNRQPGLQIKYSRLNSFVDVQVIEGAGHHVYADKPERFNALICRICESLENGLIQPNNL